MHRTPREVLATVTVTEFIAYLNLGRDRADEAREASGERGHNGRSGPLMNLEDAEPGDIAGVFGAKVVRVKVNGEGVRHKGEGGP